MSGTGMRPATRRRLGWWLATWAGMVLVLVLVGGATRLTESGLSITEWKPVTGVIPPLDEALWEAEFARYKQIPEYTELNAGMTLAQFKVIYLWEFAHRFWARLVGLALALPLAWFLWRRQLPAPMARRIGLILLLTALQGALGWYMVKSGLSGRTDVSQYRLAAHLSLALLVYAMAVWTAAGLFGFGRGVQSDKGEGDGVGTLRHRTAWFAGFVFITIVSGAFVAGLDAGHSWNTFPLMGGALVPPGYLALSPWYLNLFENVAAVQFHHRLLGLSVAVLAFLLWRSSRGASLAGPGRRIYAALALLALLQVALGVATLLLRVPVPMGVLHQLGAVLVLTAALLARAGLETTNGRQDLPAAAEVESLPPVS